MSEGVARQSAKCLAAFRPIQILIRTKVMEIGKYHPFSPPTMILINHASRFPTLAAEA
jgi:RecG-like helicase